MNIDHCTQVNCLTEIFVERALKRAAELDEHLATTGKVVGPLHGKLCAFFPTHPVSSVTGLPISLKDQINIKGLESTMGKYSIFRAMNIIELSQQDMSRGSASTPRRTPFS